MRPSSMAGHVTRPVGQCLACYRLNQVSNSSWDSYKYPMPMEFNTRIHTHTPYFRDSTCKAPILSILARCSLVRRVARL
jgi:hypothetical protein